MFYNAEVLTNRKGGWAVYWLAATLVQSAARGLAKVSKKQLLDCAIVKACENLIEPEEPLSLRLMSNLMLGIVRVFSQQTSFLFQDCTTLSTLIKKASTSIRETALSNLHTLPGGGAGISIGASARVDLPDDTRNANNRVDSDDDEDGNGKKGKKKGKKGAKNGNVGNARIDNLTRKADPQEKIMADMVGMGFLPHDMAWARMQEEFGTPGRGRRIAATPGLSEYMDDARSIAPFDDNDDYYPGQIRSATVKTGDRAVAGSKVARRSNIARAEDITLPAHHLEHGFDNGYDAYPNEFAMPIDEDFTLGLDDLDLAEPPPSTFARARASMTPSLTGLAGIEPLGGVSIAGSHAGRESRAPSYGGDMVHYSGADMALDAMAGDDYPDAVPFDGSDFDMDVDARDFHAKERSVSLAPERQREVSHLPTPPDSPERDETAKAAAAPKAKPKSTQVKKKATVRDAQIDMTADGLAQARANYSDTAQAFARRKENERLDNLMREDARKRMAGKGLFGIKAPALVAFLQASSKATDTSETAKTKKQPKTTTAKTEAVEIIGKRKRDFEREGTAISQQLGRGTEDMAAAGPHGDGFEHDFGGNDFDNFDQDIDTREFGRAASAAPSSALGRGNANQHDRRMSYDDHYAEVSSQMGRRASRMGSLAPDYGIDVPEGTNRPRYSTQTSLPWNIDPVGDNLADDGLALSLDGSRRGSVGVPEALRRRSRTPSIGSIRNGLGSDNRAGSPYPAMSRYGSPAVSDLNNDRISRRSASLGPASQALDADGNVQPRFSQIVEGERRRMARLDDQTRRFLGYLKRQVGEGANTEFLFSDIVPVLPNSPTVAASAFYHILTLASKSEIRVIEQIEPYGEIRLALF